MAAPGTRCPHCNAPLTMVDGKEPTECPYCHTLLARPAQSASGPAPAARPNVVPFVVMGAVVSLGAAFFLVGRAAPEAPRSVEAPVSTKPVELPLAPPTPPQPAAPPPPPSPVKQVASFGEEGTNPGQLHAPTHLAVASDGSIFVAETGSGRVQRFSPDGVFQGALEIAPDKLTRQHGVFGLAADATGKVYVNRVGDVLVYEASTMKLARTIAGDYPDRYYHGGIAVDGTGAVWAVTDRMGDGALVKTSHLGKYVSTLKAPAKDLAIDGTGQLFLVNDDGFEVRSPKGEIEAKVGGVGGRSLAFDGKGHVFVARGGSVEVLSPGADQRLTLPIRTDEVALDAKGRLYALEGAKVSIYEVTLP